MHGPKQLLRWAKSIATDHGHFDLLSVILLITEVILLACIIKFVPYTEIDWKAYMQEVEGVINGTVDYSKLKGDTGPLVYPAGFVYVFIALYFLTDCGSDIETAQWIFAAVYFLNLSTVLAIYRHIFQAERYPPYMLLFLVFTAYRIHSIYVLRLFNDTIAMLFLYIAVWLFMNRKWFIGSISYSFAVSIKMNIMLFSPGLLLVFLQFLGWRGTLVQLVVCALVQIAVGAPFLLNNPISYLCGAFNFGRVFLYEWTVNWRVLPEWVFLHKSFHLVLLLTHLLVIIMFGVKYWVRSGNSGQWSIVEVPDQEIAWILFTSNFIGMTFARSLHYQFYTWYFHTLPFLFLSTTLPPIIRIGLLLMLEWAWNVYPSTTFSSASLHIAHITLLGALYFRPTNIYKHKKRN